jgi:4-hydroxyphenylpyruvate dioxygenase-like putative hemolysin
MHGEFGPIRQLGYVVRDIERAMEHWVRHLRIGPWFHVEHFQFVSYRYRGVDYGGMDATVAMANSGDMQIELIQQRCDTPSLYRDFLATSGEGLQHLAFWPDDYDAACARAAALGYRIGHDGALPRGRFVYYESSGHPGTVFELNEITAERRNIIATIRDAAAGWDGSHPIRRS